MLYTLYNNFTVVMGYFPAKKSRTHESLFSSTMDYVYCIAHTRNHGLEQAPNLGAFNVRKRCTIAEHDSFQSLTGTKTWNYFPNKVTKINSLVCPRSFPVESNAKFKAYKN